MCLLPPSFYADLMVGVCVSREVDMCVRSDVWAAVSSRLQELLTSLDPDLDAELDPDPQTTLNTLQGLGLILHLAGLCYSPTRSLSLTHTHTLLQQTHTRVG